MVIVDPGVERATADDWKPLVEKMTPVQKLIHLGGRFDSALKREWTARLFDEARETWRQAVQDELYKYGCPGVKAIVPEKGAELKAIKARVDFAVSSIAETYNLELARAVIAIGESVKSANRYTYASRLFGAGGWDTLYWRAKAEVVGQIETMEMVNAGISDFHARNGDVLDVDEFNVLPLRAICPLCEELVKGNPYSSFAKIEAISRLPVHVGCVHYAESKPVRKLTNDECRLLWAG